MRIVHEDNFELLEQGKILADIQVEITYDVVNADADVINIVNIRVKVLTHDRRYNDWEYIIPEQSLYSMIEKFFYQDKQQDFLIEIADLDSY
ncbi:MAG: hypothetical protein U9O94_05980 [Nanoarchaeota archaeon]|nr:hypothetical protein [Nanoarchaeota archaeon]